MITQPLQLFTRDFLRVQIKTKVSLYYETKLENILPEIYYLQFNSLALVDVDKSIVYTGGCGFFLILQWEYFGLQSKMTTSNGPMAIQYID